MKKILLFGLIGFVLLVCDSCSDTDRIPSTTGALKCVDLSEYRNDSLVWTVNLLQPFEINKDLLTNYKYHSDREYFLDFDNAIYNQDFVLHSYNSTDTIFDADSVEPGNYHVLIISQRYYYVEPADTSIYKGETLYAERFDDYKYHMNNKPILVSNVHISADSISQIDVDFLLELAPYYRGDEIVFGIEEPYIYNVVYSEWDGTIFSK